MADSYDKAGYLDIAETHLRELLCLELSKEQKLEALCFLADIQVSLCDFPSLPKMGTMSFMFARSTHAVPCYSVRR